MIAIRLISPILFLGSFWGILGVGSLQAQNESPESAATETDSIETLSVETMQQNLYEALLWLVSPEADAYDIPFTGETDQKIADPALGQKQFNKYLNLWGSFSSLYAPTYEGALQDVWSRLSPEEQQKILIKATNMPTQIGEGFSMANRFFESEVFTTLVSDQILLDALTALDPGPSDVSWDGEASRFVYHNQKVNYQVAVIVTKLADQTAFKADFDKLDSNTKRKIQINQNTADSSTHREPFDLIQGAMVRNAVPRLTPVTGITRVALTKILHRALFKLLDSSADLDERGHSLADAVVYQSEKVGMPLTVFCYGMGALQGAARREELNAGPFGIGYASPFHETFDWVQDAENESMKLECGGRHYPLKTKTPDQAPLPLPPKPFNVKEIVAQKGMIKALVTYSLTEETNSNLLAAVVVYMASKGYVLMGSQTTSDAVETYSKAFLSTDIVIPVAHLIDINRFSIGRKYSQVLKFGRLFHQPGGVWVPVEITAFFSLSSSNASLDDQRPAMLDLADLARLLSERRRVSPHSLIALTMSCGAQASVVAWTNAYRASLELDIKNGRLGSLDQATDLVYAIAPKGGFPTDTPSELILDFIPALNAVESLAQGQSVHDVYRALQSPIKPDFAVKALEGLEKFLKLRKPSQSLTPLMLDPVFNQEMPWVLSGLGYVMEIGQGASIDTSPSSHGW